MAGSQRLVLAIAKVLGLLVLSGCQVVTGRQGPITSFGFLAADNPELPADYPGQISGTDIWVWLPFYVERSSLAAAFTSNGRTVLADGVEQVSGATVNDFRLPVEYVVVHSNWATESCLVDATRGDKKLMATDARAGGMVGCSVSIDGENAILGAWGEDAGGSDAGAAYVFHRVSTRGWDAGVKLTAPDASPGDRFGCSVSLSGDYAIVGSIFADGEGSISGSAYVFHRTGTRSWDAGVKLTAPDAEASERFGCSVWIDGDYAIVGADYEDAGGAAAGAAYVFQRAGPDNTWGPGVKLVAADPEEADHFGFSVSIDGDWAIVGALHENAGGTSAGAAYVFRRTGTNNWDPLVKLVAPDAQEGDRFGVSVALCGDCAIVGALGEDAGGLDAGAAYVFCRTGIDSWDAGLKLAAPDAQAEDLFGRSVSLSGDYAIVGAKWEDAGGADAGAAYVFHRQGDSWDAVMKLVAADAHANDYFGSSVSISGGYALVGASENDAGGTDAGAAYIYQ